MITDVVTQNQINTKLASGDRYCCGRFSTQWNTHLCCKGQIFARSQFTHCCADVGYNDTTSVCCGGKLYRKTEVDKCCGSTAFKSTTGICCKGKLSMWIDQNTSCCEDTTYQRNNQLCCRGTPATFKPQENISFACCGKRAYSTSEKTCCCGHFIDPTQTLCCNEKRYTITASLKKCLQIELKP